MSGSWRAGIAAMVGVALGSCCRVNGDPVEPPSKPHTALDLASHIVLLKKRVPQGFTVVAQPPFAVVGDEPDAVVRRRASNTIRWAVDLLKKDFFKRDPDDIIDVWLFQDEASYNKWSRQLFGDNPDTPFGYYSSKHAALIMNISTGGGTLVHEIVHPFMRANFPDCPPWFNEGMGSLFEQCGEKNGRITGRTNWRLPALQVAIKGNRLPSFPTMMTMTEAEFYGRSPGQKYSQHYAQARYLCYYLQEQGLLVKFYHRFSAGAKQDPHGIETLKQVLSEKDLVAFQKRWEAFVLKLAFE